MTFAWTQNSSFAFDIFSQQSDTWNMIFLLLPSQQLSMNGKLTSPFELVQGVQDGFEKYIFKRRANSNVASFLL